MSTTMTIRLEPELKSRLAQLAESTNRSKSFLAAEAIRDFIELNEWQIQEIKQAIKKPMMATSLPINRLTKY